MLDLPDELMLTLTTKPKEALIHVDFLGALRPERLQKRINESEWTHAVGFRPTGARSLSFFQQTLLPSCAGH